MLFFKLYNAQKIVMINHTEAIFEFFELPKNINHPFPLKKNFDYFFIDPKKILKIIVLTQNHLVNLYLFIFLN